ncbi:MAG: hypothetical protein M5R40_02910 [Anaerolineae bacterium]|nr:hypothetical protein [Anaerolineae bacterium]
MFHRRAVVFLTVIAAALLPATPGVGAPAEAGGLWSAWLYADDALSSPPAPELARVHQDGRVERFPIPMPAGATLQGTPRAFSADGGRVALCMRRDDLTSVRVLDIYGQADLAYYELGQVSGCDASPDAFNQGNAALLAVGVVNYFPGDPNRPADDTRPIWELRVLNLDTGEVEHRLTSDAPAVAALSPYGSTEPRAFIPLVRYFNNDVLVFALVPWGTGGVTDAEAYHWILGSETVAPVDAYGKTGLDTLDATGETVWLTLDQSRPSVQPPMPIGPLNVVMYANMAGDRYPIFHQPTSLIGSTFIDNGRRVAVLIVGAYNPETDSAPTEWVALDRAGAAVKLSAPAERVQRLVGAPEGYAFLQLEFLGGDPPLSQAQLYYHRFVDGGTALESRLLWEDASQPGWDLVWSSEMPAAPGLNPFPALGQ